MSLTTTDPISDMLTRIRNAINVNSDEITLPYSKIKESVANILAENNFLISVGSTGDGIEKKIHIVINNPGENARINEINRISKPGRRNYAKVKEIPTIKSGRGIVIISTPKGIMTGGEAKKLGIGGELICKVY